MPDITTDITGAACPRTVNVLVGHPPAQPRRNERGRRQRMPGNTVKINNSDGMQWYVGDSKMDEVIETLNRVGSRIHDGTLTLEERRAAVPDVKCEECNDTGYYGDNGPGRKNNNEFQPCDCCTAFERATRKARQRMPNDVQADQVSTTLP